MIEELTVRMLSTAEAEEVGVSSNSIMRNVTTSIVEDQGIYSSSCGYCKSSSRTSVAQGLWAHTLTVNDYQELLNRGWRRSGRFLYKPNMRRTCCPPHGIRLAVDLFVFSKEQARVMRRMQRYLEGTYHGHRLDENHYASPSNTSESQSKELRGEVTTLLGKKGLELVIPEVDSCTAKKKKISEMQDEAAVQLIASIKGAIMKCVGSGSLLQSLDVPQVMVQKVTQNTRSKLKDIHGQLEYTSGVAFAIAAALKRKRNETSMELSTESGSEVTKLQSVSSKQDHSPTLIAEMLVSQMQETDALNGLTTQACNGHVNFLSAGCGIDSNPSSRGNDVAVASRNTKRNSGTPRGQASQEIGSQVRELSAPAPVRVVKSRSLEIQMNQSSFDAEEFALYKKYQIAVHNDRPEELKESSYCRFLVDTPLVYVPPENDGSTPTCGFGSFHQQYRIDGRLVAVGVVDILPHCLSSKYLFWDPDLAFLSLGKYSALREIQWVKEANKVCPSLSYYYLGFYIHSCPKMRYKAAYAPSELLCPATYVWVPYELAKPALDRSQYMSFSICGTENPTASENPTEKIQQAETLEETSEVADDDEELSCDAEEVIDAESLALDQQELHNTEDGLVSPHPREICETMEKDTDHPEYLGRINLLLNNRRLSFKHLEELGVVPSPHMQALTEELTLYMQGVGPNLASRMAFVPA